MTIKKFFNEMTDDAGSVRSHYSGYSAWLSEMPQERIAHKRAEADALFHRFGITFAVYGEDGGKERLIPFDIIPRIIPADEWKALAAGLRQRVKALNAFIHDVYHDQNILKAGRIPKEYVLQNGQYRPEMKGIDVAGNIYAHIAGVDVVRAGQGEFYVLEDNLRVPSGVSYMLENRKMMMRLFPRLFSRNKIAPVDRYPDMLLNTLRSVAPTGVTDPIVVVLTPGAYNSAYFEHAFLAQQMGVELVEGQDLFVDDDQVFMRTTRGPQRVDVIYRRIDDDFLDPLVFRKDSVLGVAGLMRAYHAGRVTLCNAVGTGVADDKSVYVFFPDPWWKNRHKKRLLFTPDFAAAVLRVLQPGGVLHFVTDVADYFQMVTETLAAIPQFHLLPPPDENAPQHDMDYLTNFERKFRKEGRPIYRSRYRKGEPAA